MPSNPALRVAIVGAGPAGIYTADILSKTDLDVGIDLFERLPAPFGLVRYGVAPDHPRIKQIIVALYKVLQRGDIRLIGNVDYGTDVTLSELREYYDAVIFCTGAIRDAVLPIPGVDLKGSYGAADFVSWYDGHPDVPRTWPLEAKEIAVLGVGNVALDVARMLAKHVDDLLPTEVPENVVEVLRTSTVTDVHIFGRRGPAQVKFTPLELRDLGHVPDVDIVVYPEDFDFDEGSEEAIRSSNQTKQVVKTLTDWTLREPGNLTASRRPNDGGRVLDEHGNHIPGIYATGWIKRGPVGLIGHTKSDASETIRHLVEDVASGLEAGTLPSARSRAPQTILDRLETDGVAYTTWQGWERLDAHERSLGEGQGRERVKVVPREEMTKISRVAHVRS